MADRLEYQGNPLPSGLPGIGDPTVTSLSFPQQGTYFPPIVNGPVVDIPVDSTTQPPSPTAPVGNDPATPTTEVVDPGIAPNPVGGGFPSVNKKLDKVSPCPDLDIFFRGPQTVQCNYKFKTFTVCEDGSPVDYDIFVYDEEG
jgi:hypothetical protein